MLCSVVLKLLRNYNYCGQGEKTEFDWISLVILFRSLSLLFLSFRLIFIACVLIKSVLISGSFSVCVASIIISHCVCLSLKIDLTFIVQFKKWCSTSKCYFHGLTKKTTENQKRQFTDLLPIKLKRRKTPKSTKSFCPLSNRCVLHILFINIERKCRMHKAKLKLINKRRRNKIQNTQTPRSMFCKVI